MMTCSSAGAGQGAGLAEDQDPVAERHQRRDRGDLRRGGQRLLGLGVDLAEDHVVVALGRGLEDRGELHARTAPGRPEVDDDDVVVDDGLLEGVGGQRCGGHVVPTGGGGRICSGPVDPQVNDR